MAHLTIPEVDPIVTFTVTSSTTGPFNVSFPITAAADLVVLIDGVALADDEYTYTPTDTRVGGYQTGYVTLDAAVSNCTLEILREIPIKRTDDFARGPVSPDALNTAFDRAVALIQDLELRRKRAGLLSTSADIADFLETGDAWEANLEAAFAIDVRQYGVDVGRADNKTEMLAAIAAANTVGRAVRVPYDGDGVYTTDMLVPPSRTRIVLDEGVRLKLKNSATPDGNDLAVVKFKYSNSYIRGGVVDANKAGQDKAGFNAGDAYSKVYSGVIARGTSTSVRISDIDVTSDIENTVDFATYMWCVDNVRVRSERFVGCGSGAAFYYCDRPRYTPVYGYMECDGDAWRIYPHCLDFMFCTRVRANRFQIVQSGDDKTSTLTSLSDWHSGITVVGCEDVSITDWSWARAVNSNAMPSVSISVLGSYNVRVTGFDISRCADVAIEVGGGGNLFFGDFWVDGEYVMSGATFPGTQSHGWHCGNIGYLADFLGRSVAGPRNVQFSDGTFTRLPSFIGQAYSGRQVRFSNVHHLASQGGVYLRQATTHISEAFPSGVARTSSDFTFIGCDIKYNELDGVVDGGNTGARFIACDMSNNGQYRAMGAVRNTKGGAMSTASNSAGYRAHDTTGATNRRRTRLLHCRTQDDQTQTGLYGSVNPATPNQILLWSGDEFHEGQTVTLIGAGVAGADLTTQILEINEDIATLATACSTFTLTTLTGTFSTSGRTITGVSSVLLSEIPGPAWLNYLTNYRRISAVSSNTAGQLLEAFPSNVPPSTAIKISKINIQQVRGQDYGISANQSSKDGTTDDLGIAADGHDFGVGNRTGNVLLGAGSDAVVSGICGRADAITLAPGAWTISVLNAGYPVLSAPPTTTVRRTAWAYKTANGACQLASFVHFPHGGVFTAKMLLANTSTTLSGTVPMKMGYYTLADGNDIDDSDEAVVTFSKSMPVAPAANNCPLQVATGDVTIRAAPGETLALRLYRDTTGDTLATDVYMMGVILEPVLS